MSYTKALQDLSQELQNHKNNENEEYSVIQDKYHSLEFHQKFAGTFDNNGLQVIQEKPEICQVPFKDWVLNAEFSSNGNPAYVNVTIDDVTLPVSNRIPSNEELRAQKFEQYMKDNPDQTLKDLANRGVIQNIDFAINSNIKLSCFEALCDFPEDLESLKLFCQKRYQAITKKYFDCSDDQLSVNTEKAIKEFVEKIKELAQYSNAHLSAVIALEKIDIDCAVLEDNEDLQKAVIAVNNTGQFDQEAWNELTNNQDLPSKVVSRNNEAGITTFRQRLNDFTNQIDDLHKNKTAPANAFVKSCKKADKEFLLHGNDSAQFRNATTNVEQALEPLEIHRHKGWRIAATVLASLTVVGALIGAAQAGIQKFRGKNPDYLFMTRTESAQKTENVMSSCSSA